MRICIPTMDEGGLDARVGEHFGRVPTYTIVDTESGEVDIIQNNTVHMGGAGYPPDLIHRAGADVMLCGGLGRRAVSSFEELGIMVFVGAVGTVKDAVQMWKAGQLEAATDENACAQHAFRGEGTGHGHGHHH